MRCLALATAWQARGHEALLLSRISPALGERVKNAGVKILPLNETQNQAADLERTIQITRESRPSAVVVDGYHFDSSTLAALRTLAPVVAIDDDARLTEYPVDLLLNQNLGAERLSYKALPETQFLLGPHYALLRQEFSQRTQPEIAARASKVLVTFGGSDPAQATSRILTTLDGIPGLTIRAVLGADSRKLDAAAAQIEGLEVIRDPPSMAELMEWADLAVSAAGSTCWELACVGVPTIVVAVASNQTGIAEALDREGVAINLGSFAQLDDHQLARVISELLVDAARRRTISARGRTLVDGHGASRVAAKIADIARFAA